MQAFSIFHHFWLVWWNFEKLHVTMLIWLAMFVSTIVFPFMGMKLWANIGSSKVTLSDQIPFIVFYIAYLLAFFYLSLWALFALNLPCACNLSYFQNLHFNTYFILIRRFVYRYLRKRKSIFW